MNERHHRIVGFALVGMCLSLAQTAAAHEDPLRIAVCARFVASLCFTQNASALSNPFKSEKANIASEAYKSVVGQAWERLGNDRRGATDEYRRVLQTAKSDAMQAEDLDEAVKLDGVIKTLDGGVREYRKEALRLRVENTTWNAPKGRWVFFPDGQYGVSRDKTNAPKPKFPWEVVDVNTIIGGRHPYFWVIRFAGDMRTAKVDGRNEEREFHFELRRRGGACGGSESKSDDDFKSREVPKARQACDDALDEAQERYRKVSSRARSAYRKALKSAKKFAMKAEDLDEAVKLNKEIKSLDELSSRCKALAHAIGDTTWRPEDGDWRFDFYADRTYSYNQKKWAKWEVIDENTIIAGSHPFLWLLTFDDDRKRTHLRGSIGKGRLDLWMVRSEGDGQPSAPGG